MAKQSENNTVFLFGWAGCQQKYLEKYASVHEKHGWNTVQVYEHVDLFINRIPTQTRYAECAKKVHNNILNHMKDNEGMLIIHVFCNGGGLLWCALSNYLQQTDCRLKIDGVIFECTLGVSLIKGAFGFVESFVGCFCANACLPCIIMATNCHYCCNKGWVDAWEGDFRSYAKFNRNTKFMFLYSKQDRVIPREDVEKQIKAFQAIDDLQVEVHSWKSAAHVQLLRADPTKYDEVVMGFLSQFEKATLE